MQYFLSKLAEYILSKYKDKTSEICIVTPNRRSGLFFRKHLGKLTQGPIWAPDIISLEDFLIRLTGLNICDNVSLNIEFYKVYREIHKNDAEPLESFLKWAPALLKDFNDIDTAIVEPDKLFDYLKDVKYIETWSPDGSELTEFQKKYLKFFEDMGIYYSELVKHLQKNNIAYQGLSIRHACDNIESLQEKIPWKNIIFAGFNAMSNGEEKIIKSLVKNGIAEVIWDADKYYLDNEQHEAGLFLRKYRSSWSSKDFKFISNYLKTTNKKIHIAGIPKNVNQAKLAGNILSKLGDEATGEDTALVLANENLLLPALNSMPENITTLNVTMGFPLKRTSLYGYFESIFKMHIDSEKFGEIEGYPRFYHKDIIKVLHHNGTKLLCNSIDDNEFAGIANAVIKSNRVLHSVKTIKEIEKIKAFYENLSVLINENWNKNPETAIKNLLHICNKMEENFPKNESEENAESPEIEKTNHVDVVDEESVYRIKSIFNRLQLLVQETDLIPGLKTLFTLFQTLAAESKLSFTGEPLKGLQVLGMLETRNLDFKNIIITSVNEDILPTPSKKVSFIHYDVRCKFGMHVYSDLDALYAYHFYRLLQRAENIFLIYNNQTQKIGSSEKSRFITQLEHEISRYNPGIEVTNKVITMPLTTDSHTKSIEIKKSEDIINRLYELNERGFSPSALSIYISCPLRFYLNNIAEITETDEVEETIEANTLGSIVHEVLKELYINYKGKIISYDDIETLKPRVKGITEKMFKELYPGGNIKSGKNLLYRKMAERYTHNFLSYEQKVLKQKNILSIVSLEDVFRSKLTIKDNSKTFNFNFKGTIDRVDSLNGDIRIIDYKTGYVDKKDLKIEDWQNLLSDKKHDKAFQLLMYTYIYHKNKPQTVNFIPGIFSLRKFKDGLSQLTVPEGKGIINDKALSEFEKHLCSLMLEIFNKDITFSQTTEEDNCRFCPFKIICNRQ